MGELYGLSTAILPTPLYGGLFGERLMTAFLERVSPVRAVAEVAKVFGGIAFFQYGVVRMLVKAGMRCTQLIEDKVIQRYWPRDVRLWDTSSRDGATLVASVILTLALDTSGIGF